jgi:UPF0176 protein
VDTDVDEAMTVTVSAFYKFIALDDAAAVRDALLERSHHANARGTILVAPEGINGTISAAPGAMTAFLATLRADARFADMETKTTTAPEHPFKRLKVKLKREIIAFGRPEADPSRRTGHRVAPADWNALIAEPDVFVLDTRNAYEIEAGTFEGAHNPRTRHFRDFPSYVAAQLDPARHRRIAMFCTGGIRCEKASAYLLAHGFTEVHQLDGGILRYLAEVPAETSRFQGTCFVFDERETVGGDDGKTNDERRPNPTNE